MRQDVLEAVTRAVRASYPGVRLVPDQASYYTDGGVFRAAGIPTYGVSGMFLKDSDSFAHGLNERMPVHRIQRADALVRADQGTGRTMISARAHAYVCRVRVAAGTMLLLAAYAAHGQSPAPRLKQTPSDDDIPKPLPIESSLAGATQPDISRFLNVRTGERSGASPDGMWLAFRTSITGTPQVWTAGSGSKQWISKAMD